MGKRHTGLAAALLLAACVTSAPPTNTNALVSPRLERFASEGEFLDYLRTLRRAARESGEWWAQEEKPRRGIFSSIAPPPPPPSPPAPGAVDAITAEDVGVFPDLNLSEAVQREAGAADFSVSMAGEDSVTNVQTRGVDEGGIVKQIGRFLIVLQDGRLFSIDTGQSGESGLALADRINVYRASNAATWYDEMLVHNNRVLVTGYSYDQGASEISVFALGDDGALTRESVYYLTSNDYYDIENYATRLVDDNLVIYTPLDLTAMDPSAELSWPLVRRWLGGEGARARMSKGMPIFSATDIYRPVQATLNPFVHAISVCPLGSLASGDELDCSATAFIGPAQREFYISTEAAYLWVSQNDGARVSGCDTQSSARFEAAPSATLYRAPFDGAAPGAMHVRGVPRNQMGFASDGEEFRALLVWSEGYCRTNERSHIALKYFSAPLSAFSATPRAAAQARYVEVPSLDFGMFEQRFTEDYVVYGARDNWSSYPPDEPTANARAVAVPLTDPARARILEVPHNVIRLDRVGGDAIITGYHDDAGLSVSILDLSGAPRVASTTLLAGRYEAENRSHAFNASLNAQGDGLLGLPTVGGARESGRFWFRSAASDISFLGLSDGGVSRLGELSADEKALDPSYRCEVSCVDWYGNTRPIFTRGRVFALMGTELVEGAVEDGAMRELRRLNLSARPPQR